MWSGQTNLRMGRVAAQSNDVLLPDNSPILAKDRYISPLLEGSKRLSDTRRGIRVYLSCSFSGGQIAGNANLGNW